jgi:hypothetical protein
LAQYFFGANWKVYPHKFGANANGNGMSSGVKIDIALLIRDNPWKFNRQETFEELRPVTQTRRLRGGQDDG